MASGWVLQASGDVLLWPGLAEISVELLVDGVWRRPSASERVATNKLGERVIVAQPEMNFRFQVKNTSVPSPYSDGSRFLLVQARPDGTKQPVFDLLQGVGPGETATLAGWILNGSDVKNVKPFAFGLIGEGATKSSGGLGFGAGAIPENLGKLLLHVEEARLVACAPRVVKHVPLAAIGDAPLMAGPKAQLKIGCHVPGLSAAEVAAAAAAAAAAARWHPEVRTSEYTHRVLLPGAMFRYKDEAALLLAGEIASLPLSGSGAMKHDFGASSSSGSSYGAGKYGGAMKHDPGAGAAMKYDPGAGAGVGSKRSAASAGFGSSSSSSSSGGGGTVFLDGAAGAGSQAISQPHDGSIAVLRIADDDDDAAAGGAGAGAKSKRPRKGKASAVSETITRLVKVALSGGQQAGIREMLVPVLPAGGTASLGFKCDADGALELLDDDDAAASRAAAGSSSGSAAFAPEPAPWYEMSHFYVGAKSAIAAEKHESRMQSFDAARAYNGRLAGGGALQRGRAWTMDGKSLSTVSEVLEYAGKTAFPVVIAFSGSAAFTALSDVALEL